MKSAPATLLNPRSPGRKSVSRVARTKSASAAPLYRMTLIDGDQPTRSAIIGGKVTGKSLRELRVDLELTLAEVSAVLGTSERTVIRKEKTGEALTTSEADRAYRIARIADLAVELIGDAARAKSWMKKRHAFLGDETPITMLDTEVGTDLVVESLYAISHGATA